MTRAESSGARRKARTLALQSLYESDSSHHPLESAVERLLSESTLPPPAADFVRELSQNIERHRAEIDRVLEECAPAWPLEQIARVDRNILRIAIAEILFDNKVPLRAAINEAVELAKTFGSDSSARFVNGVLGAVAARSGQVLPTATQQEAP